MTTFTRLTAAVVLPLASLAAAGAITAGTASAASGLPDLSISTDRSTCTTTVTNKGPVTAINAAVFTTAYGGLTSSSEDIAPGASRKIRYLDCTGFPALTYTYDTNGDSNRLNNITLF
ncbi:hypothetical protein [Williamsia phyllosphaerae]|uniref:Uncharacterized protein n=1 Tax=Williamsia phyllosphaerae TaxID=885042 RepID=A0ABQ1UQA1_9NOCA|nr:hypothetical protein [Williamsia phyllosphaerae]GGF22690.1 hypothetical protein GCM10007298_18310 [Williamsia phyllosphaerae]